MTVVDFMRENGFTKAEVTDVKWQRGYVKRDVASYLEQEIMEAGGRRKGQYYVLMPAWESSAYCYRYYLTFE